MNKPYIKSILQDILNHEFKDIQKRRIEEYNDRLAFSCVYCQDSSTNNRAKRGTLYWKNCMVICFNCDKKVSFNKMCKDYDQQLDPDQKLAIMEHVSQNITYSDYEDNVMETQLSKLLSLDELTKLFNTYETPITDFKLIERGSSVHYYLTKRGIPESSFKNIYEANYWRNADSKEPVICLMNRVKDKVLGMQIRNLKDGKARLFKIYNYESLYKWLYGEDKLSEIDLTELVIYNKFSYYFGILNIDPMNRVTVFEGYLDSLFYPNAIGVVGVNTSMNILESNLDLQYFYDNDITGHKNSAMKLKDGFPVFLWLKLFDDMIKKKQPDDPFAYRDRILAIKDLNKLAQLTGGDPYKKLQLQNYFSKDQFDAIHIPKPKREYKKYDGKKSNFTGTTNTKYSK